MALYDESVSIFQNEKALTEEWVPNELPNREEEFEDLKDAFRPATNNVTPENIFIFGKTGQGKTAVTKVFLDEFAEYFENKFDSDFTVIRASFHDADTSYQAVGELLTKLEPDTSERPKGHSLGQLNNRMFDALDEVGGFVVLVLDEIDNLGSDDDLLYQLPRARSEGRLENSRVSFIGIANDMNYKSNLSAKADGTLNETNIRFAPYNAEELKPILQQRAEVAFEDGVVGEGVVPLCAAFAAQDKGSARQAIRFLYKAGMLARRQSDELVSQEHVREARELIEEEIIVEAIRELTMQDHLTLLALASLEAKGETPARTNKVHSEYKLLAQRDGVDPLSKRSLLRKIPNLSTYSFTVVHEVAGGTRGGTRYESELDVDLQQFIDAFNEEDRFSEIACNLPV